MTPGGTSCECDPPKELPSDGVIVLQPYGSLFFASASLFEETLPAVARYSRNCVVILRLRRRSDLGTTFMDVLLRYAQVLASVCSKLVIVSADERLREQFDVAGLTAVIGEDNIYRRTERVGATVRRAAREAADWVAANRNTRQCQS